MAIVEDFDSYDEIICQLNTTQVFTSALGKYFLIRDKNNFSNMIESIRTEVDNVGAVYQPTQSLLENVKISPAINTSDVSGVYSLL